MNRAEKAKEVTPEFVLAKLYDIVEDPEIEVKDKLAAIKMVGEHLKMFTSSKHVQIDIRGLVARMTDGDLRKVIHGGEIQRLGPAPGDECSNLDVGDGAGERRVQLAES